RVSRPGCRVYTGNDSIPKVMGGLGTAILSTPKGIQTGKQAKKDNVGGEVLCHVW
ncbi:MAG TPA: 30S ribosomal protein S8, partial [Nitrospirota bacterium]